MRLRVCPRFLSVSAPLPGGAARPRRLLAAVLVCAVLCLAVPARPAAAQNKSPRPKVTDYKVEDVKTATTKGGAQTVSFKLTLTGAGFGRREGRLSLSLLNEAGANAVVEADTKVVEANNATAVFNVSATPGPYKPRLKVGGVEAEVEADVEQIDASNATAATPADTPTQKPTQKDVSIKKPDLYENEASADLHRYSLVIKAADGEFATDPRLIAVQIEPPVVTDVSIRSVTPKQMTVDFWGPDKFAFEDVSLTFYDKNNPLAVIASSKPEEQKEKKKDEPKADKNEVEIKSTAIVFLQRNYGIGRLKIEGKGFGRHDAPPGTSEEYLLCHEPLAKLALDDARDDMPPSRAKVVKAKEDERCPASDPRLAPWNVWKDKVEKAVKVALVPRNPDLRIEQTKILYIDDKLIDVYFEFNRYHKFSEPLRLANVTVTVKKDKDGKPPKFGRRDDTPALAHVKASAGTNGTNGAAQDAGQAGEPKAAPEDDFQTYIATKEVGTRQDENLEYRYTILENEAANSLFGKGIGTNFYVIQLAVVNKGPKKIAVPLAAIQAEIEWAYGYEKEPPEGASQAERDRFFKNASVWYEEGPTTLSPLPLAAVSGFFDTYNKTKGVQARLFNYFEGASILGTSLFPFFGPGFKDAHGAFTGGLVPGLRRGLGDLTSQQLQNLTALSWQNIEVVASKGGSVDKFIFIQRGDQLYNTVQKPDFKKQIKNIQGIEVIGFEVEESEAKSATLSGQQ